MKQALGIEDISATCNNFKTVPGCGLSVTVSHVDEMEIKGGQNLETEEMLNYGVPRFCCAQNIFTIPRFPNYVKVEKVIAKEKL